MARHNEQQYTVVVERAGTVGFQPKGIITMLVNSYQQLPAFFPQRIANTISRHVYGFRLGHLSGQEIGSTTDIARGRGMGGLLDEEPNL